MNPGEGQRKRLSVAMVLADDAEMATTTLESVREIADEIVVADINASGPGGGNVAALATHFLTVPWDHNFSSAPNRCLQATTGDWILCLDAGETLTAQGAEDLRGFVDTAADAAKAYRLLIHTPAAAGGFASLQVAQHRLIPRHPGLHFSSSVRETLDLAVAACGLQSETIDLSIHRPDLAKQLTQKLQKARRVIHIYDKTLPAAATDTQMLLARAEALADLGEWDEARLSFQQARQSASAGSIEMLESYYGELASYDNNFALREQQLNLCIEALKYFPVDMQLLCAMGNYLQQQQRIDLAARSYQTAVQYGQINFGTWHLTNIVDIATTCLSVSLELQDKQEEAFALLENTLLERPHSDRIRYQLIDLHVRHGRRKEAIEQAARLSAEWPHREAFTNAVRGACLAGEENWSGAIAYLQTAFDAGCCDVLCLRWLSLTYAALEQFDAAQEVLEQWRAVEPDSREIPKIITRIQGKQFNPPLGQEPNATESVRGETFQIHPPDDSLSPTKRKTTTADIQPGENPETA